MALTVIFRAAAGVGLAGCRRHCSCAASKCGMALSDWVYGVVGGILFLLLVP